MSYPPVPRSGVFPIAPTPFLANEDVDWDGAGDVIEYLVDAGVDGICILANYSEQFSLTDDERTRLQALSIDRADGRVPIIVTTSHFSARIAAQRSKAAQEAGASMVMLMPPYHGATLRASEAEIRAFFATVAEAIDIPIMIQDAPMSGTTLTAAFLAKLAGEYPQVTSIKAESAQAAAKLRAVIALAGDALAQPFDGEESITLIPDLEAGATGTMPSAMIPDVLGKIVRLWHEGQRDEATALWESWLPMIHYENRQCGLQATKILMEAGGIISSRTTRAPLSPVPEETRQGLLAQAARRDPYILRWRAEHPA
jgi:4-hydroxy-tetrahydrodipicolinate synthase